MPHKHKRKRGNDDIEFDLPPTETARPLPVATKKQSAVAGSQSTKRRRKDFSNNDVPRAFRRLMAAAHGKKAGPGLDDGNKSRTAVIKPKTAAETPRIRPGEDLRSFASRVDAALPVSGLARKTATKDGKDVFGLKVHRTRKERKMHKLYDQWRAEERKIQEKREEELELIAEKDLENDAAGILSSLAFANEKDERGSGKNKRNKKSRRGASDVEEDPWLELKRRRAEAKVSLHDVALAPPELHKKTSKLLKVGGAAVDVENVPRSAGSLRRREELQATRHDVMEAYRRIREHEQSKLNTERCAIY